MLTSGKNYYEVLEIPTDASHKDINKGYTRAKNAYSQDSLALYSLMTKEECDEILNLVEEAYTILSEPHKRKLYDEARGLNTGLASSTRNFSETDTFDDNSTHSLKPSIDSTAKHSMTKIVAKNRFKLEFDVDPEFEQELEQVSEWTGALLKKIREYKQVDIPRLADMTKVSKTYLRHIEEEDLNGLPATVYVRGFVYQYAKCLKLNPELVATSYLFRLKTLKGEH